MKQSKLHSERHLQFQLESIYDLNHQLRRYNTCVLSVEGEAVEIFAMLGNQFNVQKVMSYRESGTSDSFLRDKAVQKLLRDKGIRWDEFSRTGIKRGAESRQNWSADWEQQVRVEAVEIDLRFGSFVPGEFIQQLPLKHIQLAMPQKDAVQPGGRIFALQYLNSFFEERHRGYFKHISKPEAARYHCSRLSAYIAWGNLSIPEIWRKAQDAFAEGSRNDLQQFVTRLKWQAHFVQKFETDGRMEFENQNVAFNAVRNDLNLRWVKAWKDGLTGYPLVDACMRCVAVTGYLNFRMRAMVVSFLTHHLWQPWQVGAEWLGSQFLDFEPGIHFPQFQMQAATTGMHTIRIYEPIKQSMEHDSEAVFIRKWLPELAALPKGLIHQPHVLTPLEERMYNFRRGIDYPLPVVDTKDTGARAGEILWNILKSQEAKKEATRILNKHVVSHERKKAMNQGRIFS